ncbi:hypothetical protein PBMB05447_25760 [Bacillus thuringiensis F14-1]|nr:hypothetical protein [Bacillus wiedmannii]TEA80802.1 hypothetical protein PBMB05447_25760 [Bacillus thuringiensis F14-1]
MHLVIVFYYTKNVRLQNGNINIYEKAIGFRYVKKTPFLLSVLLQSLKKTNPIYTLWLLFKKF